MAKKAPKAQSRQPRRKKKSPPPITIFEHLSLGGIRLIEVSAKIEIADGIVPNRTKLNTSATVGPSADETAILVDGLAVVESAPKEGDETKSNLKVQVHYQCVYKTAGDAKIEDFAPHGQALCILGMVAMWPYFRETVQAITSRMGIRPVTIPILMPNATGDGKGEHVVLAATVQKP